MSTVRGLPGMPVRPRVRASRQKDRRFTKRHLAKHKVAMKQEFIEDLAKKRGRR